MELQYFFIFIVIKWYDFDLKDVVKWSIENVANWAREIPDVIEADVTVLKNQRVNGRALLGLTYGMNQSYYVIKYTL
jgi:hypothetical protein